MLHAFIVYNCIFHKKKGVTTSSNERVRKISFISLLQQIIAIINILFRLQKVLVVFTTTVTTCIFHNIESVYACIIKK